MASGQAVSTRVVSAILVLSVALVWGRASDWAVWCQVVFAALALVTIVVLTIREGNRARIKDEHMLEEVWELRESVTSLEVVSVHNPPLFPL